MDQSNQNLPQSATASQSSFVVFCILSLLLPIYPNYLLQSSKRVVEQPQSLVYQELTVMAVGGFSLAVVECWPVSVNLLVRLRKPPTIPMRWHNARILLHRPAAMEERVRR